MLKFMICNFDKTLFKAMELINSNVKGAVFIIGHDKKLCGILTDGDIRRALLEGHDLKTKVGEIVKGNFVYAKVTDTAEQVRAKMTKGIKIIPIVDKNFRVVDYVEDKKDFNFPIAAPDLKGNELKYLVDAFLSTRLSNKGEYIERFETGFADFCNCKHGVAVSNGTVALHLALTALNIGHGDEVIVPDLTFAATINAVLYCKATPVIVDIEKDGWCIDPGQIKKAITPRTKAIIPVHLYGQPCDMHSIMKIAKKNKLFVIEDCAEAHGAKFAGNPVGSIGDIGTFSFYGNKVITTGEGGMCVTNSRSLDEKLRLLRDHGMNKEKRYWHDVVGFNYRMTNLQASIGVAQLERIAKILESRKNIENKYKRQLKNIKFLEFQRDDLSNREKITWLVCALIKDGKKDICMAKLKDKGIDVRRFFYPLSAMDLYKPFTFSNKNSAKIAESGISFPTVYENVINIMIKDIRKILEKI